MVPSTCRASSLVFSDAMRGEPGEVSGEGGDEWKGDQWGGDEWGGDECGGDEQGGGVMSGEVMNTNENLAQ